MNRRRASWLQGILGMMTLAAVAGCTVAESRDNPEDEPLAAAADGAKAEQSMSEGTASPDPSAEPAEPRPAPKPRAEPEPATDPQPEPAIDPQPEPVPSLVVPTGTRMTFRLEESISTKSSESGDVFRATLTHDVLSRDGAVLMPVGVAAWGKVVEAEESRGSDQAAVLAVRLESVAVSGQPRPLDGTIVEADASAETRDSGGETAAKVAVGTAAGAVLGRIIGKDTEGTLIGAGAGAVAGTVFAVTTKGGHAQMDKGALLTVELDEPLVVR